MTDDPGDDDHYGVLVDPANLDQLSAWNGSQGAFWAERGDRFDEGVAEYRQPLFAAAAVKTNDDLLDIGCGGGQVTRDAARQASRGSALGVDLSVDQLKRARLLAAREGLDNATFLQADAQVHPFATRSFDLMLSRHGVMFFSDPVAAFTNLRRALRPRGRLVLLTWQPPERNEWMKAFRAALTGGLKQDASPHEPDPRALSDPGLVMEVLGCSGFSDVRLSGLDEQMYFGSNVGDAFAFLSGQFAAPLSALDADDRAQAHAALLASLAEHQNDNCVRYESSAWLIEAQNRSATTGW